MNPRSTPSTSASAIHWKAHNNAYPKLIKMPPEELRQFNIVNSFGKPNEMWGVPIEIDPNTTGVIIAVDEAEIPLVEGYSEG